MTNSAIDVAEVLRRLKQEVREEYRESQLSVSLSRVSALEEVHAAHWVNPHQPIAWPHWPKGVWPKLVALVQKVVRRLLSWYINPIVEEQNRFNAAVMTALDVLSQENALLRAELQESQSNCTENAG
jgi:hypothetical protein